jgi:hypothetical protein
MSNESIVSWIIFILFCFIMIGLSSLGTPQQRYDNAIRYGIVPPLLIASLFYLILQIGG